MTSVGAETTSAHGGARRALDLKAVAEGDRIGEKYEVVRVLGRGGIAFVVAARNVQRDEIVTLRLLRPEFLADRDIVERFTLEARAASKIENEHVASILEIGTMPDGAPFIVREYLEGKDLGALVREQGAAPVACACELLLQACEGLAAGHAHRIVHRDINPHNLFLARSAQGLDIIKLLDFGISKLALTGSVVEGEGPPLYMSPEQIRASSELDARTDIWSLGCVFYELLTGHAPFEAGSITLLTASILERPSPSLRERRADVPEELEAVMSRCLAKDPNGRFATVSQLAAALYPFAPRRARLSVERCSQILRHAGVTPAPFVQKTIPPPSKIPSDLAATLPKAESTTRTTDEPTQVDVPISAPVRARRRKAPLWLALCTLMAAGAFLARPYVDAMLTSAAVVQETSPPLVPAAAPSLANMASATATTADLAGTPPSFEELETSSSKAAPPIASAAPKPKSRKSHKSNSQTSASQEIDVGF